MQSLIEGMSCKVCKHQRGREQWILSAVFTESVQVLVRKLAGSLVVTGNLRCVGLAGVTGHRVGDR